MSDEQTYMVELKQLIIGLVWGTYSWSGAWHLSSGLNTHLPGVGESKGTVSSLCQFLCGNGCLVLELPLAWQAWGFIFISYLNKNFNSFGLVITHKHSYSDWLFMTQISTQSELCFHPLFQVQTLLRGLNKVWAVYLLWAAMVWFFCWRCRWFQIVCRIIHRWFTPPYWALAIDSTTTSDSNPIELCEFKPLQETRRSPGCRACWSNDLTIQLQTNSVQLQIFELWSTRWLIELLELAHTFFNISNY